MKWITSSKIKVDSVFCFWWFWWKLCWTYVLRAAWFPLETIIRHWVFSCSVSLQMMFGVEERLQDLISTMPEKQWTFKSCSMFFSADRLELVFRRESAIIAKDPSALKHKSKPTQQMQVGKMNRIACTICSDWRLGCSLFVFFEKVNSDDMSYQKRDICTLSAWA